jgi:3-methylfumaryl-CoA hydratase
LRRKFPKTPLFIFVNERYHSSMNSYVSENQSALPVQEWLTRTEICSTASARRVAAMLDLDPDTMVAGAPLPRGWQFILMAADTQRSLLRADGFPGLGVVIPDLGLPRLLLGGRTVSYKKDIAIGASVLRRSSIQSLTRRTVASGPMAVAVIQHELHLEGDASPALVEAQTYLLLPARKGSPTTNETGPQADVSGYRISTFVPDETLLFQYSALGFNSHKIHIDRSHARHVEGFPDLVVNGGLVTLLLTEFLRRDLGIVPTSLKVRHITPLFCGRPITMVANQTDAKKWRLQAYDHRSTLAVDMEVDTHEL